MIHKLDSGDRVVCVAQWPKKLEPGIIIRRRKYPCTNNLIVKLDSGPRQSIHECWLCLEKDDVQKFARLVHEEHLSGIKEERARYRAFVRKLAKYGPEY